MGGRSDLFNWGGRWSKGGKRYFQNSGGSWLKGGSWKIQGGLDPGWSYAGHFTLFCSRGGGHFEVKEGYPDFLQITWVFLNAVLLLLNLKLFTCLEIITMLKWSFEMLNDFISSCSAQVIISQEVAKWLKKPAQGEKREYYHFNALIFKWI